MRRMPEDRRLAHLVRSGAPVEGALRALARTVAVFHAAAPHDPEVTAEGSRDAVLRRWAAIVAEVRTTRVLAPDLVAAVERLAGRFLAGRAPLIAQRCADDRIVDGHGDLVADDVFCLDDGPRVLDCLEFDDRLRFADGLDDAAFLAMDLERLGRPELATAWLDAYAAFSGDPAPAALRHHYIARRAFAQAKAACLRTAQGDPAAVADAHAHADLALRHLRSGAVRLVLVGGLPGTGKSTVAGGLADRVGAALLCGDRVCTELAGHDPQENHHHDHGVRRGVRHPGPHRRALRGAAAPRGRAARTRRVGGDRRRVDRPSAPRGGRRAGRAHPQRARRPALRRAARHRPPAVGHARALDLVRHHGHRGRDGRGLRAVAAGTLGRHLGLGGPRRRAGDGGLGVVRARLTSQPPRAPQPPRTTATGQWAWCSSCWLTEPRSRPRSPPRPREPTTTS